MKRRGKRMMSDERTEQAEPETTAGVGRLRFNDEVGSLHVSEETAIAIERFTAQEIDNFTSGGMSKQDWEHSRSYAVEAIIGLLRDNPSRFRYCADMRRIIESRKAAV